MPSKPLRLIAAEVVAQVVDQHRSLEPLLQPARTAAGREAAKLVEIVNGTLRWYYLLNAVLLRLLDQPLRARDRIVHFILLSSMYQLNWMRTPDHAVVYETVKLAKTIRREWSRGMLNAVLRNFIRRRDNLIKQVTDEDSQTALPQWMYTQIQHDWPQQLALIIAATAQKPPQILRVNRLQQTRSDYLSRLAKLGIIASALEASDTAIELQQPLEVAALPGFERGEVSVQDLSAQQVATLLQLKPGMRVLDGCAAPGGKTGLLLETEPKLRELIAVDRANRIDSITDNLKRLGLNARVIAADITQPDQWWHNQPFDRILLDLPCSGSGVIRRHPDIKFTRRESDLLSYADAQLALLQAAWSTLARHGKLLYVTCSLFNQENDAVIQQFISHRSDVRVGPISEPIGIPTIYGRQLLPGMTRGDGFYFARLDKI